MMQRIWVWGGYQVRDGEGSLIHVRITIAAYTLLSLMIKESKKLFGKFVKTIGECSRAVKECEAGIP